LNGFLFAVPNPERANNGTFISVQRELAIPVLVVEVIPFFNDTLDLLPLISAKYGLLGVSNANEANHQCSRCNRPFMAPQLPKWLLP
jgi:hypothetical protein